jgi:Zn-dependent peptidase ImmA (M78 family)/transcriptional regulator with XRE-family HTH domain
MNNLRQTVNPNMVILGRESRGLSQKNLAEKLGVTQGRVSKIEKGLLAVPDDLLDNLSRILDYPQHFFLQEGDRVGVGIAEIFHRKRQDVPKSVLAKIYAQMEIRLRHVATLLSGKNIRIAVHRFPINEHDGHPEEIARSIRKTWGIPAGPIEDLTEIIEKVGILVVPMDFETNRVDAISRWVPGLPPLMFVNTHSPKDRYRYSLAHELGHIVMHELPNPSIEEQANRFAAELLLPAREIQTELFDLSLPKLVRLKRYWKVSMAAILMRAKDLRKITDNQARYLWAQMAKLGYKTREPVELDIEGEQPRLLQDQIESYLKDHGNSVNSLCEVLALNEGELRAWYLHEYGQSSSHMTR